MTAALTSWRRRPVAPGPVCALSSQCPGGCPSLLGRSGNNEQTRRRQKGVRLPELTNSVRLAAAPVRRRLALRPGDQLTGGTLLFGGDDDNCC